MYGSTRETLHCKPNIGRKVTTTIPVADNNVAAAPVAAMVAEVTTNNINSATLKSKNINLSRKNRF